MYIKILGSFLLTGGAWAAGFRKAEELKERVEKLQEFKRMLLLLQGELRFHHATLSEALEGVAEKMSLPFQGFLMNMAERLEVRDAKGFEEIWRETSHNLMKSGGFHKKDMRLLEILGGSLGYLDLNTQLDTFHLALEQTEEAIAEAKEQLATRGKLYCTMGVTVGALLTLLMV